MSRQDRQELERATQALERENPRWTASQIEAELAQRAPVAYGNFRDETPNARSRLRSIQRWRVGSRGRDAGHAPRHLFPYMWPVGERQRKETEPEYRTSPVISTGSWRIFLFNCSPEVVRDVRVTLDGVDLDYEPSIINGRFAEIHWQRIDAIKQACLTEGGRSITRHSLQVDFVIARGTRQSRIVGDLTLDGGQGFTFFASKDGRRREIE